MRVALETLNWYVHEVWKKYPLMLVGIFPLLMGGGFVAHGVSGFTIDDVRRGLPSPWWWVFGAALMVGGSVLLAEEVSEFIRDLRKGEG